MDEKIIAQTQKLIQSAEQIVITCHKNPDGDAIGSTLGLYMFLKKLGKNAQVIVPNDFPEFLKWLPQAQDILIFEKQHTKCSDLIANADLIFTLDFNAFHRTGDMQTPLEQSNANFIMIDHHQQPDDFAVVTYSDTSICSTCQMVYHFIDYLGHLELLDAAIGSCLYTGIMTDTGSFRFRSTSSTTHRIIAHLIDLGTPNAEIHQNVYDNNSYSRLQLLGRSLSNLVVIPELNTAYIHLNGSDLAEFNAQKGDTEGVVNYALSLKGIKVAALFKKNPDDNLVKISFRSKGDFSVNELARTHFDGGGHINAAGGRSSLSLSDTIEKFISILPDYKKELIS